MSTQDTSWRTLMIPNTTTISFENGDLTWGYPPHLLAKRLKRPNKAGAGIHSQIELHFSSETVDIYGSDLQHL